jgi:TIR domain
MGRVPTSLARVDPPDEVASSFSDLKALWRAWRFFRQGLERAGEGERRRSAAPIDPSKPVVFLSYRTAEHAEVARTLHRALEEEGFRVWFDEDRGTMPSRVLYLDVFIEEAMRAADVLVLLQPRAAMQRQVEREHSDLRDEAWALLVRLWIMVAVVGSWTAGPEGLRSPLPTAVEVVDRGVLLRPPAGAAGVRRRDGVVPEGRRDDHRVSARPR